jgi:hypothetical protein
MSKKKQIIITFRGRSYTFTTDKHGNYDTGHAHASPRNVGLLAHLGEGGGMVNIQSLKDRM